MMRVALLFLVLALLAGLLTMLLVTGAAAFVAKLLFGVFLLIGIILFTVGIFRGGRMS